MVRDQALRLVDQHHQLPDGAIAPNEFAQQPPSQRMRRQPHERRRVGDSRSDCGQRMHDLTVPKIQQSINSDLCILLRYVVDIMEAAGFDVTLQEFEADIFFEQGPAAFERVSPDPLSTRDTTERVVCGTPPTSPVTATYRGGRGCRLRRADRRRRACSSAGCEDVDYDGLDVDRPDRPPATRHLRLRTSRQIADEVRQRWSCSTRADRRPDRNDVVRSGSWSRSRWRHRLHGPRTDRSDDGSRRSACTMLETSTRYVGLTETSVHPRWSGTARSSRRNVKLESDLGPTEMLASCNYGRFIYDGTVTAGSGRRVGLSTGVRLRTCTDDWVARLRRTTAGIPAGGIFAGAEVESSRIRFPCTEGKRASRLDPCYHQLCDILANISEDWPRRAQRRRGARHLDLCPDRVQRSKEPRRPRRRR